MLKKLLSRKNLLRAAAACSLLEGILCAILRRKEKMAVPVVLLIVWLAVSVIVALMLDPRDRKEFEANHHSDTLNLLALLGAALVFIGGVVAVVSAIGTGFEGIIHGGFLLIIAVCIASNGISLLKKQIPSSLMAGIQTLAAAGALLVSYRGWSVEPKIGCYAVPLFASCCALIASYYFMVFTMNKGSRAGMTFCCMLGTVAAFGAVFDGGAVNALLYLGWFCFLFSELSGLLFSPKKRKNRNPVKEEPEAAEEIPAEGEEIPAFEEEPAAVEEPDEEQTVQPKQVVYTPENPEPEPEEKGKYNGMSMFDVLAEFDDSEDGEE